MSVPNIVLLVADDLGWGQVGYQNHPYIQTPNIDDMASNGLVLSRFYASSMFCSPTRASLLTGRTGDRTGVPFPFYRLRLQEKTVAQALKQHGYRNKFFGKWHLNGMRGFPGAPMLPADTHGPAAFGFPEWYANTCNVGLDALMGSHTGEITEFSGCSADDLATKVNAFIDSAAQGTKPFFASVNFSEPHSPYEALPADKAVFDGQGLSTNAENQFGMILAMDRAVGAIRQKLRDLEIEKDTLVWFMSDNGGLDGVDPDASGGLKGEKSTLHEGGIRVPCVIEWPGSVQPRVSDQLAYTSDVPATLCAIAAIPDVHLTYPQDGVSLQFVILDGEKIPGRGLPFHAVGNANLPYSGVDNGALVTDRWKIRTEKVYGDAVWELYDLQTDPAETTDLAAHRPDVVEALARHYWKWYSSVRRSVNGLDYHGGRVVGDYPFVPHFFNEPIYAAYVSEWSQRPEYAATYASSQETEESNANYYAPYDF